MFRIGRVTGSEITNNRDGDDIVRLLQVEITDTDDIQTVEQIRGLGDDQNPQDDSAVIIADLGKAWKIAIGLDDGVDPTMTEKGERQIYSYDSDRIIKAFIRLLADGTININGDADNAVRFSELKTAFDQLKSDFDNAMDYINIHIHNDSLGAPTTPPFSPPWPETGIQPSTADINPAKIDEIKVP